MVRNYEAKNKPIHLWPIDFQQIYQGHSLTKGQAGQQQRCWDHWKSTGMQTPTSYNTRKLTENGLSGRAKTIQLLEENKGVNCHDLVLGKEF
jgi:hypothetical protein